MKKKLIIFGIADIGELAHFYFRKDTDYEVVAFTLDAEYIDEPNFCELPVVPFDGIEKNYPPESHAMFVSLGYSKMNAVRREKFLVAQSLGYDLASYVSPKTTVLNENRIGKNCFILENNVIQPFVEIGDNVTLWSGNHIGHHSTIGAHTFVASQVVISGRVTIGEQCFIGVNATLRDHIKIGDKTIIGAGTLILDNAEAESVFLGSTTKPAKFSSSRISKI